MANIIGFDPGMGAIKLYGAGGGAGGGVELPSQVATNGTKRLTHVAGLARRTAPPEIHTADGSFYVGLGAHDYGRPVENLDYDRLTGSPEMRALLYGSLEAYAQRYGTNHKPLTLAVGLPIETLSGEQAGANVAAVRDWLRGDHVWQTDGRERKAHIEGVLVTPQPVGALFDYVLDEEGNFIKERKGALTKETGVISIGFNTIELLVIRDKAPVERFTTGNTSGVRRLLELVNRQGLYSLGELDAQLRAGKLDYKDALPVWEREVGGEIEKRWGRAYLRFERVIVVGGGAILLAKGMADRFGAKAYVPDQPVLATARGLYKLARMQENRKRKG
ncbi:MAG: ParM/StbA family protein [Chloroflexota bacterium]|jgi:hypothetical protein